MPDEVPMDTLISSYVEILDMLHEECKDALLGLNSEQLDWRPSEGENSIAVLAVHIAGAEKFWVGDCILEESSNRDRPGEFATKDLSIKKLARVLDDSLEYVQTALDRMNDEMLIDLRTHPRTGEKITIAWALNHVIQHTALHLGHMQATRHWMLSKD
jgi:uncharacterized damage-inducible protein DinB